MHTGRGASASTRIPRWRDVSPDWMTEVIGAAHPGALITAVTHVGGSEGTSSRAVLKLTYGAGNGPSTVFAKTKGDPLRRLFHCMTDNAFIEGRLAASGAPLPIEHPRFYAGVVNRMRLNDMVVMDDVATRGAVLNDATRPLSADEVANGLRGLARLHSHYWGFQNPEQQGLGWVSPCRTQPTFRFLVRLGCTRGIPRLRTYLPQEVADLGPGGMIRYWRRHITSGAAGASRPCSTVMLTSGTPTRFPMARWGSTTGACCGMVTGRSTWATSSSTALDVDARRAHAPDLLEIYRTALDVPEIERPSREEAWHRFRMSTPYGLAIWVTTGAEDGYQDPEICQNLAARFGQAFLDLDTPSALTDFGV